jgi:hypothetical protein
MSTSIYERSSREDSSASPPSSRRRKVYRREVYGERESSAEHKPRRKHSRSQISLTGLVLAGLSAVAGIMVILILLKSMGSVESSSGNPELLKKESPLKANNSWSR